ncbi:MAG: hypothetical protein HYV33_03835 [Candidatus Kerfeldbacteria bacterium]|nr:hypothetical protein [Candidatus Kerfeldbacteria bacterium]
MDELIDACVVAEAMIWYGVILEGIAHMAVPLPFFGIIPNVPADEK